MERLLLRVEEAAEMLGLCRSKVYLMVSTGEIPVVRIGKSVRIPADRLRQWVEGGGTAGETGGVLSPSR